LLMRAKQWPDPGLEEVNCEANEAWTSFSLPAGPITEENI
jgi:hypothetical protein